MSKIKSFFKSMWEVVKFLLFTPSWGSKRRKAQQEYEERLDAAMREVDEKKRQS